MDDRGRPRNVKHRVAMVATPKRSLGERGSEVPRLRDQREAYYKCLCRYEPFGEEGLRDGSSAPLKASVGSSPQRYFPPRSPSNAHDGVVDDAGPSTRIFKDRNPLFVQPIPTLPQAGPRGRRLDWFDIAFSGEYG
jgi:hypothetical protein